MILDSSSTSALRVAIVGAGFSGTLLAIQLLRQSQKPLEVTLIDSDSRNIGRGVAYSTMHACHLLNVPAGNMSALPDDADHFLRWALNHQQSLINPPLVTCVDEAAFLPRKSYGDYLNYLLAETGQSSPEGTNLNIKVGKVVAANQLTDGVALTLAGGATLVTDKVVLALGNFPPGDPAVENPSFYESERYHGNPWKPGVLEKILETESCLLIGSGLTMVDLLMALQQAGYRGKIHTISRRGQWPKPHAKVAPIKHQVNEESVPSTIRGWLQRIRQHIRNDGADWRAVINALRPHSGDLWTHLPLNEKRRFLRHLRPYWDSHRHRLAPVIGQQLQELIDAGQIIRYVGRVLNYHEGITRGVQVEIRSRGGRSVQMSVEAVVNCSGSESDYRQLQSPLVRDLLKKGYIRPDALKLGLDVVANGALIQGNGDESSRLFTLGPPMKGVLWETTAVPEIRRQAALLAETLLASR